MNESWTGGPASPTRDEREAAHDTLEQDTRARWRLAYAQYEDALAEATEWLREGDDDHVRLYLQRAEVARAECNSCAAILGKSWEVV